MKRMLSPHRLVRSTATLFVMAALVVSAFPSTLFAASLTSLSATLSREKAAQPSTQDIRFVTPSGLASGGTLVLTYTGFANLSSGSLPGAVTFADIDLQEGSTNVCSSATYADKALVASGASSSQFNVAVVNPTITFTSGGASATITANKCVRILIGTNAAGGTNSIVNGSSGTATIAVSGTFGDTGTIAIPIIADDQVVVTATVNPTLSFTISASTVDFGALTTANAKFATSGASSGGSNYPTDVTGNTLTISTNAVNGYSLTYNGPTLTSGSNTIAAATITGDPDGLPGSAQFAIAGDATSSATTTMATGYNHRSGTGPDWKYVANTTTPLASVSTAVSDSIAMHYLANISSTTPPGSYTLTMTYIVTGNF